ncbi:YheC/YheD family protein [Paenibacillus sp. JX-17]|uniref:YheC/YheD family protein n=1 Tax=Paenibacillus lacisoli TaxID=3064525 RepID=A0ABT9C8P2_9BACL|nr:YheC/YheD family protein [Paenibacillus sp. JX-17]MDO7905617.1 YheC/YheD family protein [Paenibacillus sp. JX-17]
MAKDYSRDKLKKHRFMEGSSRLSAHLPKTRRFAFKHFDKLLRQYGAVVVKPIGGSRGRNVFQVSYTGNQVYQLQLDDQKTRIHGRREAYRYIKQQIGSRKYMVQRLISRATVKGRPFDMRIIVQRKKRSSRWKVTARLAKIAGEGYIVSNLTRSHGIPLRMSKALRHSSLRHMRPLVLKKRVDRISIHAARRLRRLFPGHRIYGLDVALDRGGYAWIIEANLFPSMSHFRKLGNARLLRRIQRYRH